MVWNRSPLSLAASHFMTSRRISGAAKCLQFFFFLLRIVMSVLYLTFSGCISFLSVSHFLGVSHAVHTLTPIVDNLFSVLYDCNCSKTFDTIWISGLECVTLYHSQYSFEIAVLHSSTCCTDVIMPWMSSLADQQISASVRLRCTK